MNEAQHIFNLALHYSLPLELTKSYPHVSITSNAYINLKSDVVVVYAMYFNLTTPPYRSRVNSLSFDGGCFDYDDLGILVGIELLSSNYDIEETYDRRPMGDTERRDSDLLLFGSRLWEATRLELTRFLKVKAVY